MFFTGPGTRQTWSWSFLRGIYLLRVALKLLLLCSSNPVQHIAVLSLRPLPSPDAL